MELLSVLTLSLLAEGTVAWPVVTEPDCVDPESGNCRGRVRSIVGAGDNWASATAEHNGKHEAVISTRDKSGFFIPPPSSAASLCRLESSQLPPRHRFLN